MHIKRFDRLGQIFALLLQMPPTRQYKSSNCLHKQHYSGGRRDRLIGSEQMVREEKWDHMQKRGCTKDVRQA